MPGGEREIDESLVFPKGYFASLVARRDPRIPTHTCINKLGQRFTAEQGPENESSSVSHTVQRLSGSRGERTRGQESLEKWPIDFSPELRLGAESWA